MKQSKGYMQMFMSSSKIKGVVLNRVLKYDYDNYVFSSGNSSSEYSSFNDSTSYESYASSIELEDTKTWILAPPSIIRNRIPQNDCFEDNSKSIHARVITPHKSLLRILRQSVWKYSTNGILLFSIIFWSFMQLKYVINPTLQSIHGRFLPNSQNPKRHMVNLSLERQIDAFQTLSPVARNKFITAIKQKKSRKGTLDILPNGCTPTSWQDYNFPTCNVIHEVNSLHIYQSIMHRKIPIDLGYGDKSIIHYDDVVKREAYSMGYVGSGLWRQVWKVNDVAVLKVIKLEHKYDIRNLDRHRRDALVMERLTSNNYIVNTYGFCGTSILTDYCGQTLEDYIYSKNNFTNSSQRIHLAIDVMKGIQAIHTISDGPIIHADIQLKQFLVDSNDHVQLNDFNRCRFIPRYNGTNKGPCKIKIPSAPGKNRSPEEYSSKELTEKIDIYSAANVLYVILTGKQPWTSHNGGVIPSRTVRKMVINGEIPKLNHFDDHMDRALGDIIRNMYAHKPENRYDAKRIVTKLEMILGN